MSARPPREQVLLGLPLVAFAAALFRLSSLGFYDDDWAWMEMMKGSPSQSWLGIAAHFERLHSGVWPRALNFLAFPGLFKIFGAWATGWHLALAALTAWGGVALWRWLEEEGVGRPTAALAAGLFLLWPNHDATRHWVALYSAPAAVALTFEALRLRRKSPVLAALALLAGGLLYEAAAPLALVPFLLEAWRARHRGAKDALAVGLRAGAPLLIGLFVLVLWQRVACPLWLHPERHPMSVSPAHVLDVARAGLECNLNRMTDLLRRHVLWARADFSAAAWLFWLALAAGLALMSRETLKQEFHSSDAPVLAVLVLVLGYAPYVLDAAYVPVVFSPTNRVNFVPSAGAALLAAWALRRAAASRVPAWRAAGGWTGILLPGVLLLSAWASNAQWAEAARRQREILEELKPRLSGLPAGKKTVLLFGLDTFVGSAPVFNSTYDLDAALRLEGGSAETTALVGEGRVRFDQDRASMTWFGETPVPYEGLYAYDHARRTFARLASKKDGEAFLAR